MFAEKLADLRLSHIKGRTKIGKRHVLTNMIVEIVGHHANYRAVRKRAAVLAPYRLTRRIYVTAHESQKKLGKVALQKLQGTERSR